MANPFDYKNPWNPFEGNGYELNEIEFREWYGMDVNEYIAKCEELGIEPNREEPEEYDFYANPHVDSGGLWMVYDSEDGLVCVDTYESCLSEYRAYKAKVNDYINDNGFECNERVILAKLVKDYRAIDTNEPHSEADNPDSEFYKTTYWTMTEDEY